MNDASLFQYHPQQTDAEVQENDLVVAAAQILLDTHRETAAAEALTRALVEERTERRGQALFWAKVFQLCAEEPVE